MVVRTLMVAARLQHAETQPSKEEADTGAIRFGDRGSLGRNRSLARADQEGDCEAQKEDQTAALTALEE